MSIREIAMIRSMRRAALLALALAAPLAGAAMVEVTVKSPAGLPVQDAAVVLEPLAGGAPRPAARTHAAIEQHGAEFQPWLSIVQAGTAVDFPNSDPYRHHVYSFSAPKRFEIKLYAGKPGQPVVFDKPGVVVIGCNIHDWMEAHVLVVDTPWFARTGADGRAQVAAVPAGRYRLRLWHPLQKTAPAPREIEVGGAALRLDLALDARSRENKPHTDADMDH
jgi:plastocyanin